ncbi:MAG TPA: hypothetical protein VFO93_19265 [Hymenobacter sp.]|uniref:hypothetical protein n=1 Tax=Hymenobacter sp. TaxID=1898978 RepID=UPI002D7FDA45|nr:hypothetical protein [Hymenobacter sp.]HET9505693.1 hypothetical protein [Hymenobacter sp.]
MTRFFCFALASLGLTSCLGSAKNSCTATVLEPVTSATGPRTVAVNQKADFVISYVPQNTCGKLASIYEAAGNLPNSYLIGPQVVYNDCNCPTNTGAAQATYSFTPTKAGTYYLNFIASNSAGYVTDTLVAQ